MVRIHGACVVNRTLVPTPSGSREHVWVWALLVNKPLHVWTLNKHTSGFIREQHNWHYLCIYIYIHAYLCVCVYIYIYIYIHRYRHSYIYLYLSLYIYIYIYIHIHMYMYVYLSLSIYIHIHTYIHLSLSISLSLYIYIYIYMATKATCGKYGYGPGSPVLPPVEPRGNYLSNATCLTLLV